MEKKIELDEIIIRCLRKDRLAQEMLFKLYYGKMMAVCLRYTNDRDTAQEILQDGFIKVFDNISKFKMEGSLEGWVRRIMVNTAINKIRSNKMKFEDISAGSNEWDQHDYSVLDKMSEQDLLKMVAQMPQGYKYVFSMYAIEGYSHKEIADNLGIEEASSRSQYAKAKKYLQQQIINIEKINL